MGSEHYCLRWNNHQSNLLGVFSQLLEAESLVDVTLASSEGHSLRAHKVVLSACSSYFRSLFLDHPNRHPIVILKDVGFAELRTLVDFMYRGEVSVETCRLSALLKTAESLQVKGLAEMTALKSNSGGEGETTPPPQPQPQPGPSPPPSAPQEEDTESVQSGPSDMTIAHPPSPPPQPEPQPGPSGLPPVQDAPLSLKKEVDWDRGDENKSNTGESSSDYRHPHDPDNNDGENRAVYSCMYCGAIFPHQSKLTRHILSHSLETLKYREQLMPQQLPPYQGVKTEVPGALCKFCGKTFPDVGSLIGHLPAHTGDRPFKCEFCGKAFKLRHHMKDHCRVHTGERPFRCSLCGKTFSRSTILKAHEKTHYPKYVRRFLSSPSPEDERRNQEITHMPCDLSVDSVCLPRPMPFEIPSEPLYLPRTSPSPEVCLVEGEFGPSGSIRSLDQISSSSRSSTPFQFPTLAGLAGLYGESVLSLLQAHEALGVRCSVCLAGFPSPWLLDQHIALQHPGHGTPEPLRDDKPFRCDQCGQSYRYRSAYLKHREQNHRARLPADKLFTCDVCGMQFRYLKSFKKHRLNHTLERIQNSPRRGSDREKEDEEERREEVTSSNEAVGRQVEGSDQDDTVDSAEGGESSLIGLLQLGERQRPPRSFACPFCGKCVRSKENLKLHVRKHTGERPFACLFCGRAFGGKSDLTRHLRIHTGERPYHCEMCGKCFARADYLSKHLTTHIHQGQHR